MMKSVKNIFKLAAGIFMTFISIFATCKQNSGEKLISGKIIYQSCATTAVEITDPDFYNLAQDDWQQDPAKPMMHHVFSVSNPCQLPKLGTGEIFKFKILDGEGKNDCIICMMYDNPPQKKHFIKVII